MSKYVSAEIPHVEIPEDYKIYRNVVTKMIHGPCEDYNPRAFCCINDQKDVQRSIQYSSNQDPILTRMERLFIEDNLLKKEGKLLKKNVGMKKLQCMTNGLCLTMHIC